MSDTIVKPMPYHYDLAQPLKKTYLDTLLATNDNEAHRFDIALLRDKTQLQLPSDATVSAFFIRYSGNVTIPLKNGSVSGNVCSVTLNKSCYNKSGQFALVIKVTAEGVTNTIFYGEGTVFASSTDTILDDENIIPSLEDLLAQIDAMENATKDAKEATDAANAAAEHAPYVDETTNHWMTWNTVSGEYMDTGVNATGEKGEKGDTGDKGADGTMSFEELTDEQRESLRGPQGEPGATPVKGTDYWTDEDITGIVNDVLVALPVWEGGEY